MVYHDLIGLCMPHLALLNCEGDLPVHNDPIAARAASKVPASGEDRGEDRRLQSWIDGSHQGTQACKAPGAGSSVVDKTYMPAKKAHAMSSGTDNLEQTMTDHRRCRRMGRAAT
jgi:hypothetical protein